MNSLEIKKIRTVIFILLLCYFPSMGHSQGTNQVVINFDDSTHFFLYINNQLINQKLNSNEITIGNLANESHLITVALDSTSEKINKSIFFEKENTKIFLNLIIKDSIPHLVYNGESTTLNISDTNQNILLFQDSILLLDSTKKNENLKNNNVITYSGNIGCEPNVKINELLIKIDSIYSSEKKLIILKKGLVNNCIKTTQLRTLLLSIPYEDHRIELCNEVYPNIYDLDNFHSLIELFKFEKSKNLFLKIIKEND
ncbi:MAG: hypothetical protein CL846_09595 [Crocinitomicaceae bacterium]|nr:hypothetical protein [Crocinitomicaceae bacterium]|tara:strand:- start:540 stop:1307 length:768 start_codon:yes stop_codon:yes gene_type:complete